MYPTRLKRPFDISLALSAFLLMLPVFFFVAMGLAIANRGKVFFVQDRPGKRGRAFRVIKFKTMNDDRDRNGMLLPDDQRLTTIGKFIRVTSLDEIPQLINVLKGDMSLVGPRPLLMEYLPLYSKEQMRRHEVRPGITGWAQVNGRNELSWQRKFEMDVWYVDNMSFALDMKILWLTILKVFKREGISSAASATMEKFTGNPV